MKEEDKQTVVTTAYTALTCALAGRGRRTRLIPLASLVLWLYTRPDDGNDECPPHTRVSKTILLRMLLYGMLPVFACNFSLLLG